MMSSRRNTGPEIDDAELRALIQLRMLPAITYARLISLLSRHTAKSLLENAEEALGAQTAKAAQSDALQRRADLACQMVQRQNVIVLTMQDPLYPDSFRRLGDFAPPILFCRGRTELLATRNLAIVGARDSTEYGDSIAAMFATELARRDVAITSGLARGIDSVAHVNALDAGGNTIACLGCGIDVHYPPRNARLQERIADAGLLISEFAPGDSAFPYHFPQRNRLIALLGAGVLVIEAGPKSGTRKTVEWALDYGIDVFAVPGPIGRYESQGTNEIIQDGGHLVICVRDILEHLHWEDVLTPNAAAADAVPATISTPSARSVFEALDATAVHIDEIARRANLPVHVTLAVLVGLEIDGIAVSHAGKRFSRNMSP